MAQHEILDEFYHKLNEELDEEFIESLKKLIFEDNFSKDNFINLIDGAFDGKK